MISAIDNGPTGTTHLVDRVEDIFSPTGVLSKSKNFEYRPEQQTMAVAVARALVDRRHLVVEAGTGVGKSLAYLIPAVLYAVAEGKKAIVSTHTINLQEQLTEKDLPLLQQIIPARFSFTMLKGRQNYLCTRRLQKAVREADALFTSPGLRELERIEGWAKGTRDGSTSDFEIEPDPKVWAEVCSERGLCAPRKCGAQSDFVKAGGAPCFFQQVRSQVLAADVLVLNHTLFFLLLGGLEEAPGEGVLFKNDFVIFDEAHTMERVASRHIGLSVSSAQIRYNLQRLWNERTRKGLLATLRRGRAVSLVADAYEQSKIFFDRVETACEEIRSRAPNRTFGAPPRASGGSAETNETGGRWSELRIRQPELVEDNVTLALQRIREAVSELIKQTEDSDKGNELRECNRRVAELREAIQVFLGQSQEDHVYWVEKSGKRQSNLTLNAAPVDIAEFLRRRLFGSGNSIVMTSATLGTRSGSAGVTRTTEPQTEPRSASDATPDADVGGLLYFIRRVGADSARKLQVGSPFDYAKQMRMYVAGKMPDPRASGYRTALVEWIEFFVRKTRGKAFVLFTNTRLMQEVAAEMESRFQELGVECYVQGTGVPRTLMLEQFKENVESVLFGTESFWQGVDVPGEALSNVIVTRLPFAVPNHPLIEARIERIEASGGNAFMEFSLPEAILRFRQGVGRLIRTQTDQGIIAVLDNRILTKRYGQAFLDASPRCPLEIV